MVAIIGFETFCAELHGESATYSQANQVVSQLQYVKPDYDSIALKGSTYYTIEDGSHIIEIEVCDSPIRVSCRFTLCHPPSVDRAFLEVVRTLMLRLGMEARVCDDVCPEHSGCFNEKQFAEFAQIVVNAIAKRRAEWISNVSSEIFPAKTCEVYEKVILPECVPVVKESRLT